MQVKEQQEPRKILQILSLNFKMSDLHGMTHALSLPTFKTGREGGREEGMNRGACCGIALLKVTNCDAHIPSQSAGSCPGHFATTTISF